MFGVPLETAIERSKLGSDNIELPIVFRQCIDFIEDKGERPWDTLGTHITKHSRHTHPSTRHTHPPLDRYTHHQAL